MASTSGFSIGVSPEEKLALPLDTLILQAKTQKKGSKAAGQKPKKPAPKKKQQKKSPHQQQNVKKTVLVPVSKAARARVNYAAASSKRQAVINKRRPGLKLPKSQQKVGKRLAPTVQLRRHKTSLMRATRAVSAKPRKGAGAQGLDVSNILHHFRTHPKKFDVPKGSNLRITINLNNVKPVVGGQKN